MSRRILVVDDEEKIRTSLRGVLTDEGYEVALAEDGRRALEHLALAVPDLVLLDVWLPGIDGLTLLERIREDHPTLPVIVICGHANIEAAVRATRLGAADFIEKPFSIDDLLASIDRALGHEALAGAPEPLRSHNPGDDATIGVQQKTILRSVTATGLGLHTGVRTGIILHPLPPGSGIVFQSLSSEKTVPAHVDFADSTGYATTLYRAGFGAKTVEHLLAAANCFGVTNLLVKMEAEVPILDGSALGFCDLFESAGLELQDGPTLAACVVARRFEITEGMSSMVVEPADRLTIDYTLDYPEPVGRQRYVYEHQGPDSFRDEIAPARTFGFVHEFKQLASVGLAAGGRLDNCVLIGEDGVINGELRFKDEFVRHKILDVLGDFALLGTPLVGRITAVATGHRHNVRMVRELLSA